MEDKKKVKSIDDKEALLFQLIGKNDENGVRAHMMNNKIDPNICDENGMSPLAHAAYKGNFSLCQLLIDRGADPKSPKHEHDYSPLHFAGLSGKSDICQLLLEAGANPHLTNSVGRTAAETAAFVGNHYCVAVINNWIPRSEVDYFTQRHGLEAEPKLPSVLASPLYNLITRVNIHPVRVALNFQPVLSKHLATVKTVLDLMSEREMKRGTNTNEIVAFKLHYIAFIAGEVKKHQGKDKEKDAVETFIRTVLRSGRGEDYMDKMIRECVREFPHRKSTLFVQMVTSLAKNNGSFEAYSVLKQALLGARALDDDIKSCATCEEERENFKKCSKCKQVFYCDRECQRLHWFIHKKECDRKSNDSLTTVKRETKSENSRSKEEETANEERRNEETPTPVDGSLICDTENEISNLEKEMDCILGRLKTKLSDIKTTTNCEEKVTNNDKEEKIDISN